MAKRVGIEVSLAIAEAVKQANVDVVSAYPITPQTHIVEHLSEIVADGDLDAEFICVESEHTAMSACIGSAAAGARTFTSTASQGLALMHEIMFIAASMRFPIVMALVNRALSSPLSIWNDHSDIMASRDCGWIQYFVENGQEAYDHTLIAYRVAEHKKVMLPVAVNLDGFILSHMIEPHVFLEDAEVKSFLPVFKPLMTLHPDKPITMGAFAIPELYTEAKKAQVEALAGTMPVIMRAWERFAKITGRQYRPVETYRAEDAEVLLLTMGGISETAMTAVDHMREQGKSVGLVRIRLWRPFPSKALAAALKGAKAVAVVDRAISFGAHNGPVCAEVKSLMYKEKERPVILNFVAGLGGRDVPVSDFEQMADRAKSAITGKLVKDGFEMIGVRE